MKENMYLTPAQMKAETERCLQCANKPCKQACPAGCSPCDFIAAAKRQNWQEAARLIREKNALAETCGLICPDCFCRKACVRAKIDYAVKIPQVQAYIMRQARKENYRKCNDDILQNGKKIAVVGLGPAGIGAVAELLKCGCQVTAYEQHTNIGGALNLIPEMRLPREVMAADWQYLQQNPLLQVVNEKIENYDNLKSRYDGVVVAIGECECRSLGINNENFAVSYMDYLRNPNDYVTTGNVAVIGGGSVAVDCVAIARQNGAKNVEMFVRRKIGNMRITEAERQELLDYDADITTMTRVADIVKQGEQFTLHTIKTRFNSEGKLEDIPDTQIARPDFSLVIAALGCQKAHLFPADEKTVFAGDCLNGGTTAVQALASGKEAALKLLQSLGIQI